MIFILISSLADAHEKRARKEINKFVIRRNEIEIWVKEKENFFHQDKGIYFDNGGGNISVIREILLYCLKWFYKYFWGKAISFC